MLPLLLPCCGQVLKLTPQPQYNGTNLTCQVNFPAAGVTMERTIQLNVTCAPENAEVRVCLRDGTSRKEPSHGALTGTLVSLIRVNARRKKAARTALGVHDIHSAIVPASL
ncbi:hypothetical protein HPG69_014061, partial [Diceros bicornis minor]